MNGSINRELAKAMINDRQREARRARLVSEARAAARDDQDGGAAPGMAWLTRSGPSLSTVTRATQVV